MSNFSSLHLLKPFWHQCPTPSSVVAQHLPPSQGVVSIKWQIFTRSKAKHVWQAPAPACRALPGKGGQEGQGKGPQCAFRHPAGCSTRAQSARRLTGALLGGLRFVEPIPTVGMFPNTSSGPVAASPCPGSELWCWEL